MAPSGHELPLRIQAGPTDLIVRDAHVTDHSNIAADEAAQQ
jgi:hypothetical protein